MKAILLVISGMLAITVARGQADFEKAKKNAAASHQLILLYFSGSDWCVPCIKMHKEIFENDEFKKMADSLLILVNADFPRSKKNQQDINTRKQNEMLADNYNPKGAFPYTLLLDANGKVIKAWEGMPKGNAASFSSEVRTIYSNYK